MAKPLTYDEMESLAALCRGFGLTITRKMSTVSMVLEKGGTNPKIVRTQGHLSIRDEELTPQVQAMLDYFEEMR